eukprot:TRINITY_DN22261_c0_g1_i1.p1 TRINITY_DN22261_c0_g1~~TRINITY_DN22261_c0_g1_i1.p1  ORF type:complete len:307 (-),score=52.11 TRINITY_DN22261_c0_g1_i1:188-1054(-)
MPTGPLGDAATEQGLTVADGIRADAYKCLRVSWPLEGVLELVLGRVKEMNAMSLDLIRELHQICDVLQYPQNEPCQVRVVILRGEGPGFCAGFDFKDQRLARADQPFLQHAFSSVIRKLREIPQPVVCGINGVAAGGGLSLALASDVRICVARSRFVPSFVKLGLGGGELGTSYFLPRIVGRGRAASLLLTGKEINATEAERWGLVTEVVPDDAELIAACRRQAEMLLSLSPKGLRLTKWLLNGSQEMSLATALEREDLAQSYMSADKESVEVGWKHVSKFVPKGSKL